MTNRVIGSAVGFTVKSGWACVVLLTGSSTEPKIAESCRIELSDPAIPDARQPYHAGFGTARDNDEELARLVNGVRRYGVMSVSELLARYRTKHPQLGGAGIVVGSLIDPETVRNDHIRIHALEGKLFREVVIEGAAKAGLRSSLWRERDLYTVGAQVLKQPDARLRKLVSALGQDVGGPWRVEQKAAATAAWLVLAS